MTVKVTRYGGVMARAPKERVFSMDELDPAAREALRRIETPPEERARVPDGYTYAFEVETDDEKRRVELPGRDIPDALRALLPK